MRILVVLLATFCLFFVPNLFAQEHITIQKQRTVLVKWAPLNLIDPAYPALQVGVEFKIHDRWSLEQQFGGCLNCNREGTATQLLPFVDAIKARTQGRFYLNKARKEALRGSYLAVEGLYVWSQYQHDAFFVDNEGRDGCFDKFDVKRRGVGLNGLYGTQFIGKRGFVVDFFTGVGIRHERVQHLGRNCLGMIDSYPDCLFCSIHDRKSRLRPSVSLGIKLGWGW